jgi:hypothetical protein
MDPDPGGPRTQHCLLDVLVEPPGHDLLVTERAGLHLEDLEAVLGGRVLLQLRPPSEQGDAGHKQLVRGSWKRKRLIT